MSIGIVAALAIGSAAGCDRGEAGRAVSAPSAAKMEAGMRAAIRNPDQVEGYIDQARLVALLDAENLSGARTAFEEEVPTDAQLRPFVRAWARIDAPGAFEGVRAWPEERSQTATAALEEWAAQDPSAALLARRIQQIPLNRVFQELARTSRLEDTWRWADSILESPQYSSDFKLLVLERALFHNAGVDPASAAQWLDSHLGNDYARRAARLVVGEWMQTDPDAALAWATSLPEEGKPGDAVSWGYMQWFDADREAAEAWIRATPLTPVLWGAAERFARRLAKDDPENAASWCEQLTEAEPHNTCIASVGELWARSDRDAAAAWLAESDLPEADRERILRPRGGPAGEARGQMRRPAGEARRRMGPDGAQGQVRRPRKNLPIQPE
ncbi:MAG: hypothetical protein ACYTGV_20500 [Planctomycetota bacterium]|jgi:hypothetical protein